MFRIPNHMKPIGSFSCSHDPQPLSHPLSIRSPALPSTLPPHLTGGVVPSISDLPWRMGSSISSISLSHFLFRTLYHPPPSPKPKARPQPKPMPKPLPKPMPPMPPLQKAMPQQKPKPRCSDDLLQLLLQLFLMVCGAGLLISYMMVNTRLNPQDSHYQYAVDDQLNGNQPLVV